MTSMSTDLEYTLYTMQAVLFAGEVETLSPGNHENVTGNINENSRLINDTLRQESSRKKDGAQSDSLHEA